MKHNQFSLPIAVIATGITFLLSSSYTFADNDQGFYIGAGLARSTADTSARRAFEHSDTNGSFRAGYMFNNNFGVDVTHVRLDSKEDEGVTLDHNYTALSGVASYPVGNFDVYGKLGLAKAQVVLEEGNTTLTDTSDTELFYGIGAEYDFGKINTYLEYNRLDADDLEVNTVVLGVKYEF